MSELKKLPAKKLDLAEGKHLLSIARAKGYSDGETCRTRGDVPSTYARVGIDDYCVGFRAGYFVREGPDLTRSAQLDVTLTEATPRGRLESSATGGVTLLPLFAQRRIFGAS
jgi:hypothetical protein